MNNYVMALFASGTTNFDYMGLGPLSDAISAIATETATSNGNITYTMEMSYPINGRLADKLVEGNLIKAQVSKTPGDFMIFEINETLKSDDRTITVYCDAYANRILRMSFDNGGKFGSFGNVQQALNAARAQMTGIQSDFTLSSGIGTSLNMSGVTSKNTLPTTYQDFNAYLDAIMDKVQGNVRFGVNSIQIVSDRGRDITDTVLRDDKNTNGISIKVDTSNIVNRIIPMLPVRDKSGNITQETKVGKIVTSSVAFKFINFYAGQVVSVDTQDLANSYFNRTHCDRPTTTATVQTSMLDEDLTDIRLFDRIQVYSSKIGYQAKLRVSERDFDILAGAVSEFKLGSSSVTIFNSQTSVINAVNSAVQSSQYAAITADGKNTAYYEGANPGNPKENDLWFHSVNGISQIDQYVNGNWVKIVSDSTGTEINQKVEQVGAQARSAVAEAISASEKTDQVAAKFDDTDQKAKQALDNSVSAQADASSAVVTANSTASAFGTVSQKADSALASALSAQADASSAVATAESTASEFGNVTQNADSALAGALSAQDAASDAVKQASSAAADSKDAKQIAGAVSQSYKTLTDGSTMTIAELQNGLAVKLTKKDLDGYATQTWSQNQINATADGINATLSSVKSTVDGQTTSINDLKADSSSFKSQFTTVNDTIGKHTTDIGSLQASSKELISGFNTLTTDNGTNKNDISQLKQTSTELSSTMMSVTQRINLDDRPNLIPKSLQNLNNWVLNPWAQNAVKDNVFANGMNTMSYQGVSNVEVISATLPTVAGNSYIVSIDFTSTDFGTYEGWGWGPAIDFGTDQDHFTTLEPGANNKRYLFRFVASGNDTLYLRFGNVADGAPNTFVFANLSVQLDTASQATSTQFSDLKQTVDSIQTEMSKKIEQKDLNGYATQTWAQNQIKVTADGINATMSSIKSTVDGHTTSINSLQADSSSFKSQFTTVNNTLGKQTTDISTLQASSKELISGFNTLTTDNGTNKNDISRLKQTATEVSSTLETVKTQVQNSAVGTNLIIQSDLNPGYLDRDNDNVVLNGDDFHSDNYISTNGATVFTLSSPDYTFKGHHNHLLKMYDSDKNYLGYQEITSPTQTLSKPNVAYIRLSIYFIGEGGTSGKLSDWLSTHRYKLEKGGVATDFSLNPADTATVTALSSLSQTVDGIKTDVSKKIEQKDLNGYATETWTQGQIKLTADGINGSISSVKSTVDGHTTSINDLKADSNGFKSQFTTVNDTLGKHTNDIGTLQASSKSLSAGFDSLNSDNDANKHNISQLQASATTFNSTLLTVQQQVTDSSVGINLLRNARSLDGWKVWRGAAQGKGFNVEDVVADGGQYRMAHIFNNVDGKQSDAPFWPGENLFLTAGQVYTISIWAHSLGTSDQPVSWTLWLNWNKDNTYQGVKITTTTSPYWKLYSATFKATVGGQVNNVRIVPFFGTGAAANVGGSVYLRKPKLERGSRATDFSVNPADNATVSAVSSISQNIESIQTTVRGKVDNNVYQSKMMQLDSQITSVVGQVNTLGQRNLVANSRFQYDKFDGSTWTSDKSDNWYSSDYAWSWWNGYQGICCNIPISNPVNTNQWNSIVSKKIYVPDPGSVYSASAIFNVGTVGNRTQLVLDWYDKSMKRIGYATKGVTIMGTQNLIKIENQTPPAGTAYVALQVDVNGGGHLAVIAPMLVNAASVGSYVPDNASWTEFQQTASDINLKVSKDGVVSAINISPESITIDGKRLHITAATYIDNAVIKDAMIANLSANKLTAGSINAANINVYNINGANIVANSITADKLQAGAMLIAMNSTLQTLKIGTDGVYTTDRSGKSIGKIHTNRSVQHPENWGLDFDLDSAGKFMSWGAQNEGDPNGDYGIKFGWTRNSAASDFAMPWGGFWFNDNVMLHKNLRFDGGGIDVAGAYQLMKFAWIEMNGTRYPFFGSSNLRAGWLFGSTETYLVRGGGVINASKILGVLNGQSYKFIKSLNPDGSVKVYTDVHF